ncbi:hypothetical protein ACQKM2_13725 [Streptomyces sp. NPDC004126]|uniref:hypothetical protein n=1 Tax=Streptomyces sp. NPDC004126 TaxID=3390695 RepID=UPI003CFCFEDB
MAKFKCTKFVAGSNDDTKNFLATPGAVAKVAQMLKFDRTDIDVVVEAVCTCPEGRKLLVMGGYPTIESEEDNREGYVWIDNNGQITDTQAIILPILT